MKMTANQIVTRGAMVLAAGLLLLAYGCKPKQPYCATCEGGAGMASVSKVAYGKLADGRDVDLYTLVNSNGLRATVSTYGAILVSMETPDRDGNMADITLGYDTLAGWLKSDSYFGATVGRYGNRIDKGKFTLEGKEYTLAVNNGENHLHGGLKGFDKVLWTAAPIEEDGAVGVALSYTSPDGEEGYPGKLDVIVEYRLTDADELKVDFKATTDKTTVVNLCHHTYWNLTGSPVNTILDQELTLVADRFVPVDAGLIPTGVLEPVEGTPFDFRKPMAIGARVGAENEQLKFGNGYDHCWVLNNQDGDMALAAVVHDPKTGRVMELSTDQPGVQFYCGNFLDGTVVGKAGVTYKFRTGMCLETQRYPDSPNKPDFPSVVLRPGETYTHKMVHAFSAK